MSMSLPYEAQLNTESQMIANFLANADMRLLGTPVTITTSTTLATLLAAEATFTGYAPYNLAAWTTPAIDMTGAAASITSGQFTGTGGGGTGSIYGYFLCDSGTAYFYGAEAFGTAVSAPTGVTLVINLTYQLISLY